MTSSGEYFPQVSYGLGKECGFFTWALRFQNRLSYKITTLQDHYVEIVDFLLQANFFVSPVPVPVHQFLGGPFCGLSKV